MTNLPVLVAFALVLALPLTLLVSGVVLLLYRRALLRWMGRPPASGDGDAGGSGSGSGSGEPSWDLALAPASSEPAAPPPWPLRLELRRRERRFWGWQTLLWLLVGISGAVPYLLQMGMGLSPLRVLGVGVAWASPGWMAQGLMARLPTRRALALILTCVLLPGLLLWASQQEQSSARTLELLRWLLPLQGIPLVALSLLVGIPALRAAAPLLYPPVLLVTLLALGGGAALEALPEAVPRALIRLGLGGDQVLLLAHLLPVLLGLWLVHGLSRILARAQQRRLFSDLSHSLAICALVVLLFAVIPSWSAAKGAAGALTPLLAWLWLPLSFTVAALRRPRPAAGPTLLVLRLFRRPGAVGWLFDQVVQRWRFLGPVLLISAADLALRTLDGQELTDFIEGRLGERFIATPAELRRQLGADSGEADHDGRHRVHDLCCHDGSWQGVLEALLQRSGLVLMDLRGFQASNRGCLHELQRLAATRSLSRVVLLVDRHTDRATAEAALAGGPPLRWVEERRRRHPTMEAVLNALCEGPEGA